MAHAEPDAGRAQKIEQLLETAEIIVECSWQELREMAAEEHVLNMGASAHKGAQSTATGTTAAVWATHCTAVIVCSACSGPSTAAHWLLHTPSGVPRPPWLQSLHGA